MRLLRRCVALLVAHETQRVVRFEAAVNREFAKALRRELVDRLLLVTVSIGIGAEAGLLLGWFLSR